MYKRHGDLRSVDKHILKHRSRGAPNALPVSCIPYQSLISQARTFQYYPVDDKAEYENSRYEMKENEPSFNNENITITC